MARQIFRNNVTSMLAGSLASGATSLGVSAGSGVLFPSPTAGDFFLATLYETDVSGNETRFEVVQVTARSGDVLTIVRDFESMTGSAGGYAYPSTAGKTVYFDCRWTAYAANNSLQASSNLGDLASDSVARTNLGLGNVDNTSDATILAAAAADATNKANARQEALVSGDNLKTVNGESLLGDGNLAIATPTMTATVGGSVPTPPNDASKFLNGQGVFATPPGGGAATWGSVTGTLADQTDLQTALNGKEPAITAGTSAQYIRGDKTLGTMPTTLPASDVYAWAKAATKPTYTYSEVGAQPAGTYATGTGSASGTNTGDNAVNSLYSGLVSNANHTGDATGSTALTVVKINGTLMSGLATGLLKNTTGTGVPSIAVPGTDYQAPLVSGTNIKTINSSAITGAGNLDVGDVRQAGSDLALTRQMLKDCGCAFFDSSTTNEIDYTNGSVQRWAPATGAQTLSIINWPPSGNLGELFIEGINLAAATITFPAAAVFIKSDGTESTFAASGITLQASGTDWLYIWTRDAGTKIYIKVVR